MIYLNLWCQKANEYNIKNRDGHVDDIDSLEKDYGEGSITLHQEEWDQLQADDCAYQESLKRFRGYCHQTNTEPTEENYHKFHTGGAEDEYLKQCANNYIKKYGKVYDDDGTELPF